MSSLTEKGLIDGALVHTTLYPLSLSRVNKNFDYTSVLERMFGLEGKDTKSPRKAPDPDVTKDKVYHLTKKEKLIMKGLLQYPELPDNKIANLLDTTRQAVARHKKELLELDVIKKLRVIDYTKMGIDILCLLEAHYDRMTTSSKVTPDIQHLNLPSFFSIYGDNETVSLSLFQDFRHFSESRAEYTKAMTSFCKVRGEPFVRLFSPKDTITFKHLDYLPLVDEFLSQV
jgi:DNA-binding Lrp family transcriptional regulator